MKKAIFIISTAIFILNSCSSDPAELDIDDLEKPCDFVEAFSENYKAQIKLYEENEDEDLDDWKKKDRKKIKKLSKLISKIEKRAEEVIEDEYDGDDSDFEDDAEDCENYNDFEDLQDELRELENEFIYNMQNIEYPDEVYENIEESSDDVYYLIDDACYCIESRNSDPEFFEKCSKRIKQSIKELNNSDQEIFAKEIQICIEEYK